MTRHVDECHVYVETSRIRDRLLSRTTARGVKVDREGRLEAPDAEDIDSSSAATVSHDEIRTAVLKEVSTSESKKNCIDFVKNIGDWLAGREILGKAKGRLNEKEVVASAKLIETEKPLLQDFATDTSRKRSRNLAVGLIA